MSSKKRSSLDGIVYSTDPSFGTESVQQGVVTPPPHQQKLRIRVETKHRGGKTATIVSGFIGKTEDLEALSKRIKTHCGTGGSAKDGEAIIQGDQQAKVTALLRMLGYRL